MAQPVCSHLLNAANGLNLRQPGTLVDPQTTDPHDPTRPTPPRRDPYTLERGLSRQFPMMACHGRQLRRPYSPSSVTRASYRSRWLASAVQLRAMAVRMAM